MIKPLLPQLNCWAI